MSNQLMSLINQEGSLGFGEACIYALIGFLIVFVGIIIIIFIIWLIGLVLRKTNNLEFLSRIGKKKLKSTGQSIETLSDNDENDEVTDEVKVAIIAAIMAYYSSEKPQCEFKVKRIKRL
ncbi:MAG: OadG family protein [Clostridia bacterium]|nr:OadG family protein [Clostridia bacterium]